MTHTELIIEPGFYQQAKHRNVVCGDTFLSRRVAGENRFVAVLSDGLGSGIKANVLSTMTASMALNFRLRNEPLVGLARSIMETLPIDSVRNISYSTFSIVDIDFEGDTTVVEYGNPSYFVVRDRQIFTPKKEKVEVTQSGLPRTISVSSFQMLENDLLVLVSDGITQSGVGSADMPFGWEIKGLQKFVLDKVTGSEHSAASLSRQIVKMAECNDILKLKDDASCAVFFRRHPRRMLICTGPPYNEQKDRYLSETVANYPGTKVLCGGTTAKIVSRELARPIVASKLPTKKMALPPPSSMEGVDLVTEGILTLSKVAELLEDIANQEVKDEGAAADIVRFILNADIVEFMVGTQINLAHQDPSLPVELELRRNVVKRIVRLIEEKLLKKVEVQYI